MPVLSVKLLNIASVLLCTLVTSFVCTYLALESSDKALDDTKENRDASIGTVLRVSEATLYNKTGEHMGLVLHSTVGFVTSFVAQNILTAQTIAAELMSEPWDAIKHWEWHRPSRYYNTFLLRRELGFTGMGVFLKNRLFYINFEDGATIPNAPTEYHSMSVSINYGDDHPWGGIGRTFEASSDGGRPKGVTNVLTDVNWANNETHPCVRRQIATQGAEYDDPCVYFGPPDNLQFPFNVVAEFIPLGATRWMDIMPLREYMVYVCLTPIEHDGVRSGSVMSGTSLSHISTLLKDLEVAGPVEGYPSRGRVFITVRSAWLDQSQVGILVGSSHGEIVHPVEQRPIFLQESSDPIVNRIGVLTNTGELDTTALALSGAMATVKVSTDYAPEGEDMFYRVGPMVDTYGADWYVHVVIDREYILGEIDKSMRQTRASISKSEDSVEDDLRAARSILFISVGLVAVGLMALSVLFVMIIILPLGVLEKEMADVALMRLESVELDRPLSMLHEVHEMQVSFLQMTRNLIEYRSYMPASVLVDTSDCTDTESARRSVGSSSQSLSQFNETRLVLQSTELHTKRATLMVCNIVGLLAKKQWVDVIGSYLAMGLVELKKTKGIPDGFSGDRLYASWNGARPCMSHRLAAYDCAHELIDEARGHELTLSVGLASGEVKCGNCGCDGMKKFTFAGSLAAWVHVVERAARRTQCQLAIDRVVNDEVSGKVYTRAVHHVSFRKHAERVLVVYEALHEKKVNEEEWMYQIADGDSKDPTVDFNTSYQLFMEGKPQQALDLIERSKSKDTSNVFALYKERLAQAVLDAKLCAAWGADEVILS